MSRLVFIIYSSIFAFLSLQECFSTLAEVRRTAFADGDEPTKTGKEMIRKAVQQEKERLAGKKRLKSADTELGKSIQKQTGAPAALVNGT
jgi:hypothetical protein